jgi:hypothetical protein
MAKKKLELGAGKQSKTSPALNPKPRAEQEEHPNLAPPLPRRRPSPERSMHSA